MNRPSSILDLHHCWTPCNERKTKANLLAILNKPHVVPKEHWPSCWEVHQGCALAELKRLEKGL